MTMFRLSSFQPFPVNFFCLFSRRERLLGEKKNAMGGNKVILDPCLTLNQIKKRMGYCDEKM